MRLTPTELVHWSARVFGDDVAERVFAPLVADWAREVSGPSSLKGRALAQVRWAAAFACTSLITSASLGLAAGALLLQLCAVGWVGPLLLAHSGPASCAPKLRAEAASRLAMTVLPVGIAVFVWRLGSRLSTRRRWLVSAMAWGLPALLLVAPSWLVYSIRMGGDYGVPAMFVRFLPAVSLLVLGLCVRPASDTDDELTGAARREA